jgi:hypothetical protein
MYDVAQEYPDYRGVYKNMGRVRKTKNDDLGEDREGEESEEEAEVEAVVDKGSDSDDEHGEQKDVVVEDIDAQADEAEEEPKKENVSHIPGYSVGKGLRTKPRDEGFPGPGKYPKVPTSFKEPVIDKREVRLKYEADQKKFKEEEAKKRKVARDGLGPGQYFQNILDIPGLSKCFSAKHSFGNTAKPPTHS